MEKIIKRTFFKFFGPTLVASLALAVVSMTDLIVAGQLLGSGAFTAISLALPVTIFVQIIAAVFGGGAGIVLSNLLGQGERERCNRVFTTALLSAAAIGVAAAALGLLFLDPLILLLGGQPGESMDAARQYIGILLFGMPFLILAPVQLTFLRNDSNPRYSMLCVLAGGVWNLAANISLVLLFDLGITGIAVGTVTSQILSCVLPGRKLYRKNSSFHLTRKPCWSFSAVREMARPGLTAAMIFFFQVVLTVVINRTLALTGGESAVGIYAVVKYLITFLYAFYDGVTGAVQPMLGVYRGEGEIDNLRRTVSVSFKIMLLMSAGITLALELGAPLICMIFGVEQDMLDITVTAIRIQALFCMTAGILAYLGAFYRCTGHAGAAMVIAVCNNLIFPVSIILLLANFTPLGSNSVYWGLVFTDYATLLVLFCTLRIFRRKGESPLLLIPVQDVQDGAVYHVLIQDKYEDIPRISAEIDRFCEEHGVPVKKQYTISLCMEELVVNVIQMGFHKERDNYIDIRVSVLPDQRVILRIRDDAVEFDPAQSKEASLDDLMDGSHQEDHNELGLLMVKKMAQSYSYKRTVGFNDFMVVL